MTADEFSHLKIGDVVRLNSGGSNMTVVAIDNGLLYCVVWNDEQGRVVRSVDGLSYLIFTKM